MAEKHWLPDWWPFPTSLSPFVEQLIPYMDAWQFLYDLVSAAVEALPHQPPVHIRPVQGTTAALFGGNILQYFVEVGKVGYDAVQREVIIQSNKISSPNTQPETLRLPVQSVMPFFWQLLIMIPVDVVKELGALGGLSSAPTGGEMMNMVFSKLRSVLAEAGVNLPELGIEAEKKPVPYEETVEVTSMLDMAYSLPDVGARLLPPANIPVPTEMEILEILQSGSATQPAIVRVKLTEQAGLTPFGSFRTFPVGSTFDFKPLGATVTAESSTVGAKKLAVGTRYVGTNDDEWQIVSVEYQGDATSPARCTVAAVETNEFYVPLSYEITGESDSLILGTEALLVPQQDRGPEFRVSAIVKEEARDALVSLLPSLATLLLYNIPVMDMSQLLYERAKELVESLNHHPPAYTKPVYAGGVYVKYVYELVDSAGSVESFSPPRAGELSGKTLYIHALYFEKTKTGLSPVRDIHKRLLFEYTFPAFSATVTVTSLEERHYDLPAVGTKLLAPTALDVPVEIEVIEHLYAGRDYQAEIEPDDDGDGGVEEVSAEAAQMKVRITVLPSINSASDTKTIAKDTLIPVNPLRAITMATSKTEGKKNVSVGDTVQGDHGDTWQVIEVFNTGQVPKVGWREPGDKDASPARVKLALKESDVDFTVESGYTVSLGGTEFYLDNGGEAISAFMSSDRFKTDEAVQIFDAPFYAIKFESSCPLIDNNIICRWLPIEELDYIGEEFNIQLNSNTHGVSRYHKCRMKYQMYGTDSEGELSTPNPHIWTILYDTVTPQKVPHGNSIAGEVTYDAVAKTLRIRDSQKGTHITLRSDMVIWFALQLALMVPVTVV